MTNKLLTLSKVHVTLITFIVIISPLHENKQILQLNVIIGNLTPIKND